MRFAYLFAYVSSEGSDKPAQLCSLVRAFPAHTHKVDKGSENN